MSSYSFKYDEYYYKNYTLSFLKTFANSEECLEFVKVASAWKKTIFIIISSSLLQNILPDILDNKSIYSIYVLFDFMSPLEELVNSFIIVSRVLVFRHELDLLTRLTRDIAAYYEDKSSSDINSQEKLSYLRWARKLSMNAIATSNDKQYTSNKTLRHLESRIEKLEDYLVGCQPEEERLGMECAEIFE